MIELIHELLHVVMWQPEGQASVFERLQGLELRRMPQPDL